MSKHTPAPWAAFTDGGHTNIVAVVPRTSVVFSLPGRDKNEADVRLIASAPQLRSDAMTMAMRLYGESDDTFSPETVEVMKRWRPLVEAELAKVAA